MTKAIKRFLPLLLLLTGGGSRLCAQDAADSFRVVVGVEKAAAVSAEPVQKLFVDLYFTRPLAGLPRARAWGDLRLGSLPRQINSTILSLPGDIVSGAAGSTVNELTQSGEFLVGMEYRLTKSAANRADVSLIASYGASTPLHTDPARSAFHRQYYAGVRIGGASALDPPSASNAGRHVVDVAIGQNDAVTGGTWSGTVIRIDSFFALPVSGDVFYLYGTAQVKTTGAGRGGNGSADVYRIGAGIDLVQLLKVMRAK